MILKGNARGGAKDLAQHLLKEENEHIEIHELRGFASTTLGSALNEAYALSRATKCRQYLYSLSLNPPQNENVKTSNFEAAIEQVEEQLGLTNQPRAIVFHEKEGRRHAHCVWSRIDIAEMKAIQLSFDHRKLNGISRELFLEHGWQMPRGLAKESERDPRNFNLAEWQKAKRVGQNAGEIKAAFQDAWAISDSKAAFIHALEERGYKLARGDRRGFVAVDAHGEVWSIARQANVKTKDVRQRLGDEEDLPSVSEATAAFADDMLITLQRLKSEFNTTQKVKKAELQEDRQRVIDEQRAERAALLQSLKEKQHREALVRQARFRTGLKGLWDRLRGEHKRIQTLNEAEAKAATESDQKAKEGVIFKQLQERRLLNERIKEIKASQRDQGREIEDDTSRYKDMKHQTLEAARDAAFAKAPKRRRRRQSRERRRGHEPEI